jgi:membrane fusion protein (multidrug efflux system)
VDGPHPDPVSGQQAMQLLSTETVKVAPRSLQETVRITGSLAPLRQAKLTARVSGPVDAVMVRPGDVVEQGDLLLQINLREVRLQLQQAEQNARATEAQLALAQATLERTRTLVARNIAPATTLERDESAVAQLTANLETLRAQVENTRVSVENATVTAPFAGIVASRSVEPGQTLEVGGATVQVVDLSILELEGAAPVQESSRIKAGQKALLSVDGDAGNIFTAMVERVNPMAIEGTRQVSVYLTIDNAEGLLRGGMFVNGRIVIDEVDNVIAVPAGAVKRDDKGDYVLTVEEGAVTRTAVTTGRAWENGRTVEITHGLNVGVTIVTAPLKELLPGAPVVLVAS